MALDRPFNSLGFAKAPADTRVVVAMSGGVDSSVVAAMLAESVDLTVDLPVVVAFPVVEEAQKAEAGAALFPVGTATPYWVNLAAVLAPFPAETVAVLVVVGLQVGAT